MPCNRTFHTQVAATTLTGTTGNNVLNAPGSVSTLVQGLAGADTINSRLVNDEAQAGAGATPLASPSPALQRPPSMAVLATTRSTCEALTSFGYVDGGAGLTPSNFFCRCCADSVSHIFGGEGSDTIALTNAVPTPTSELVLALTSQFDWWCNSYQPLAFGGKQKDTISLNGETLPSLPSVVVKALTSSCNWFWCSGQQPYRWWSGC